jgi:hypothetical protein
MVDEKCPFCGKDADNPENIHTDCLKEYLIGKEIIEEE